MFFYLFFAWQYEGENLMFGYFLVIDLVCFITLSPYNVFIIKLQRSERYSIGLFKGM